MTQRGRRVAGAVLMLFVSLALIKYLAGEPSGKSVLVTVSWTVAWILIWTLPKGALLRWMGGRRPHWSALAANASSELPSLGFPLASLGFPWPALGVSLVISTVVEGLALVAMATGKTKVCFLMAIYINIFAHLLVLGGYLWSEGGRLVAGAAAVLGCFFLFILPIFVPVVPASDP